MKTSLLPFPPSLPVPAAPAFRPVPPPHEQVATVAYRLWERAGRPDGRDQEHWFAAESELRAKSPPAPPRPPAAVPASH